MITEQLYDLWVKRNPKWDTRFEDTIVKKFTDYSVGNSSFREDRAKIFGAGYEILIIAFFLGLYYNRKTKISDKAKTKDLGQAIQFWGNSEKGQRKAYPRLKEYIYVALIAKTDVDLIALDKGETTERKIVDQLIATMEEYINGGLIIMEDQLREDANYFYREGALFNMFMSIGKEEEVEEDSSDDDDEPESLD